MITDTLTLVQNILVIFGFVYIFGLFLPSFKQHPQLFSQILLGAAFGVFGIINMMFAVVLQPGIINDIRSPIILVATVSGGWLAGLIAAGMMGAYRLFVVGGAGALGGTITIVSVMLFGLLYLRFFTQPPNVWHWLALGFASVWISVVWSIIMLPPEINQLFLSSFIPTAVILYPVTTLLLGKLIEREQTHLSLLDQLRLSERRFKTLFDDSFQFSGLLTPDGRVLAINQTALAFAGAKQADMIGKFFWETSLWSPAAQAQIRAFVESARQGETHRQRVDMAGVNNKTATVDFSIKPVFDSAGQVALLIPEGRDISSEIIAEKQRIQLGIERERLRIIKGFIEDSSHHLKTPMAVLGTSVYLFGKMMNKTSATVDTIVQCITAQQFDQVALEVGGMREHIRTMQQRIPIFEENLTELNKLIDDLLAFTRLEKPDEMEIEAVDVARVVRDEIRHHIEIAQHRNIDLRTFFHADAVYALADVDAVRIVVQNLVENALTYTPDGGTVSVQLATTDTRVMLTVQDTGIGIAEVDRTQIFERFYRADNARTWSSRGSGLGLAISKQMLEAQNGTLTVESELNVGTTFTVTLPGADVG